MASRLVSSGVLAVIRAMLGANGDLVELNFRSRLLAVVAVETGAARPEYPDPVTDALALELIAGNRTRPPWPRPVGVEAFVEYSPNALRAVQAASRWASYGPRVAVSPTAEESVPAQLEAAMRGVWLVGTSAEALVVGEAGATPGSRRGLQHWLLDELVWERLAVSAVAS